MTRLFHWWLAATTLPTLIINPTRRSRLAQMRAFCRALPGVLKNPLPAALQSITPQAATHPASQSHEEHLTRTLADLAALLERRSPLGLCLRRSLTRYHFLRQIEVPVILQFGAKFVADRPDREVTGHAWLTLAGRPYYEADENWRGFKVMFSHPPNN